VPRTDAEPTVVIDEPGPARNTRADRGSTSLTTVLLTPVFIAIAFMAFQAALWSHARTEARAIARDSAALVARNGVPIGDVEMTAQRALDAEVELIDPAIEIASDGRLVTARVTGRAPGLLRGTSSPVDITVAVPQEGFRP
jgi:Flp pilus assembly protein TadG